MGVLPEMTVGNKGGGAAVENMVVVVGWDVSKREGA